MAQMAELPGSAAESVSEVTRTGDGGQRLHVEVFGLEPVLGLGGWTRDRFLVGGEVR